LGSSAIGTLVERTTRGASLLHMPPMLGHGSRPRAKNGPALAGRGAEAKARKGPGTRVCASTPGSTPTSAIRTDRPRGDYRSNAPGTPRRAPGALPRGGRAAVQASVGAAHGSAMREGVAATFECEPLARRRPASRAEARIVVVRSTETAAGAPRAATAT